MARTSSTPYNDTFFDAQALRSSNSAAIVVPIADELVHPNSVLDVGCGVGGWLAEWQRQGISDVVGLDGSYVDRSRLLIDPSNFRTADLERPFRLDRQFDLVECLEVAEHLAESHADALVECIAEHSDTVLFSAAVPSQGGTHHVNEQWPSYWISKFTRLDFQAFDVIRPLIWTDPRVECWYRQNILLFSRTRSFGNPSPVLDVVHPDLWRASHCNPALRFLVRILPTAIRTRVSFI
jgi:SAM-dependent methyltransferase